MKRRKFPRFPGLSLTDEPKDQNLVNVANELTETYKLVDTFLTQIEFDLPVEIQSLPNGVRINDFWLDYTDIKHAVDEKIEPEIFFEWYDSTQFQACTLKQYIKTTRL